MSNITTANTTVMAPTNLDEAIRFAQVLSKSNMVPKQYQNNPGNILVAIQWGQEIGLGPLQALQNIAVINGNPSLWGDAALALVRGSGKLESITEEVTDTVATCTIKRKGEPEAVRTFGVEDAKRAGKWGSTGPWTTYPKRMMQMRARSWALRDVFPDVLKGVSIAEEQRDAEPAVTLEATMDKATPKTSKGKLAAALAKSEPAAITLAEVEGKFAGAQTLDELRSQSAIGAQLESDEDKATARDLYKQRYAELQTADQEV